MLLYLIILYIRMRNSLLENCLLTQALYRTLSNEPRSDSKVGLSPDTRNVGGSIPILVKKYMLTI